MNCLKSIILFVYILISINNLYSQNNTTKIIKAGKEAYKNGNYYGAASSFKRVLKDNKMPNIAYLCAESCRMNHDYPSAIKWYRYVISTNIDRYPMAVFWLADVYKSSGDYQKAQFNYSKFIKDVDEKGISVEEYYKEKAKYEIVACENAFYNKLEPVGFEIKHLDSTINSVYSDFGITDINDSIFLYGSLRPEGNPENSNFYAKFYWSKKSNGKYSKSKVFNNVIKTDTFHIMNPTFSQKQQVLYFCLSPANDSKIHSSIYRSKLVVGEWQSIEKLEEKINKSGTITTQPSVANIGDKEYLMFVSNREGGIGRLDIWYCEILNDGSFGEIMNMGSNLNNYDESERFYFEQSSTINSIDDEVTPFYNSWDSTLYFSSQWHQSMGGFDVYKVKGDFKNWGKTENMGYPLNTNDNELYFYINSKGRNAYFASNREDSYTYNNDRCCNDIYSFDIPEYVDEKEEQERKIRVMEDEIKLLVPLTLYFHNDEPNPKTRDTTTALNYDQTYFSYINMLEEYKTEYSKNAKKSRKEEYVEKIETFFNDEVIEGYNDLVKFSLLMEQVLGNGEDIEITIKGYASPLHASDYNVNLSKRRINSLVNYFYEYKDGMFLPYINNTASTKNRLTFIEEAYGEDTAAKEISDDLKDLTNSVYSPEAAYERKIKVIAISFNEIKFR